ncbi:uncharacterized protein LOC129262534 [Lytechinus pictus]|uniref:uncharacterized protein LOC129262534 n=1 Tax=Lytechinus pictus TaxID=7653 RepID=UPI0030B9C328
MAASKLMKSSRLVQAINDEHLSRAATLLKEGACPNLLLPAEGVTPFHLAVGCDSRHALELTTLFLQHNADPNVRSTEGLTPVHVAASWGRFQALELLLWNGGDPSIEDEEGNTAKNMAESSNHWDCINLLDMWIDGQYSDPEGEDDVGSIPLASREQSNHDICGSPGYLSDHEMLSNPSPDKDGHLYNYNAGYSWSPGSATSSTLSSTDNESLFQGLEEEDDTDHDLDDYEISFPKHHLTTHTPCHDRPESVQSSYGETSLNRALLSMNLDNYSSSSSSSNRSSSSSVVSPSLCQTSQSQSEVHSEGEGALSADEHTLTGFGLDVTSPDHTVIFTKATDKDRRRTVFCPLKYPSIDFEEQGALSSPESAVVSSVSEKGQEDASISSYYTAETEVNERKQSLPEACEASPSSSSTSSSALSSPSSGVSSRSVYYNRRSGTSLIEEHFLPASGSEPSLLNFSFAPADDTIIYDWASFKSDSVEDDAPQRLEIPPELAKLTNTELKAKLHDHGEDVGPVTATTRSVYLNFLVRLMQDGGCTTKRLKQKQDMANNNFQYELAEVLSETKPLPESNDLEKQMVEQFQEPDPKRKWREGKLKSSFNYLLLDPRVTRDLPSRYPKLTQLETFRTFVSAIFYVGKGKRSRPYAHFEEALDHLKKKMTKKPGSKVLHILDVWSGGMGVVSLHCFQNVIPVEAYTREACMIDALGLSRLTNAKRGDYYGVAHSWSGAKKRKIGVHLLHKACQIFLMEGERQIRSGDITSGQ